MSSAGIEQQIFFVISIYRFFANSTDESVECTEKSVRFTDFKKFRNL